MSQETMRLEELQQTPEYLALTDKQKLFVATYVQTCIDGKPDPVHAVTIAYECKTRNNARVMSYPMLSNIRIVAALNRYFNRQPLEAFLMVLDRAIQNKHLTVAQLQALRLKCELLGLSSRMPAAGRTVKNVIEDLQAEERKVKRIGRKERELVEPAPDTAPNEMRKVAEWLRGQ